LKRLILAAFLFAAACQAAPQDVIVDHPDMPPPVLEPGNLTAAQCAERGGTLKPVGRAQTMQCVIAYADAGKRCTTGSDCQGDCRIEDAPFPNAGASAVGRCQADSQPFGCHARVEDGKATPAICID
jgi:putative hemolysin